MAGLIIEDGSGIEGAQAYMNKTFLLAYCGVRGLDLPAGITDEEIDQALVRGSEGLDALFAGRWPGVPLSPLQGLAWPRRGVFVNGLALAPSPLPLVIVKAACEAAWREAGTPGALTPDFDPAEQVVSESVSSISVTYAGRGAGPAGGPTVQFTAIERLLADILSQSGATTGYGSFYLKRA